MYFNGKKNKINQPTLKNRTVFLNKFYIGL